VVIRDQFARDRENQIGRTGMVAGSKKLLFTQNGDIYILHARRKRSRRDTPKRSQPEFGARFLDNDRILFQQSENVFVLNIVDATLDAAH
jgi:hypothetical protein